jgi:hypothetical protein
MLDTARSVRYIFVYSGIGSSHPQPPSNSFEPIMKTTLGDEVEVYWNFTLKQRTKYCTFEACALHHQQNFAIIWPSIWTRYTTIIRP